MGVVAATLPLTVTLAAEPGTESAPTRDSHHTSLAAATVALEIGAVDEGAPAPGVEATAPPREPEVSPDPEPAPAVAEPDQCAEALSWVAEAGLPLPPGVGYHCPSTQFSHHGAACWNGSPCPDSAFIAVNLELMGSPAPDYLRHVVAHEVCHILDFQATGVTTEAGADACAARHGA